MMTDEQLTQLESAIGSGELERLSDILDRFGAPCSHTARWQFIRDGLPAIRIGRPYYSLPSLVQQWLAQRGAPARG